MTGVEARTDRASGDHREVLERCEQLFADASSRHPQAFSLDLWHRCGNAGLLGLATPAEHGGLGLDPVAIAEVAEEAGTACTDLGLLLAVHTHLWTCIAPVLTFGSSEQIGHYIPRLASGDLVGAHAMTEPGSGSDALALETTATVCASGYRLDGAKTMIVNAPVASLFVVYARTSPDPGPFSLSAFLVEAGTPGLTATPPLETMGVEGAALGGLRLEGCEVPSSARLGAVGSGLSVFRFAVGQEHGYWAATTVGVMARHLARALEHSTEREQFGRPIGGFQAVAHRVADMRIRLEACRLLVKDWSEKRSRGRAARLSEAILKTYASESCIASALDLQQTFGGRGYLSEHGVEREVRDALASRFLGGTNDVQRNAIAAELGLRSVS